jgi:PBP1b-binding outer membrane lipoprotein LpoB
MKTRLVALAVLLLVLSGCAGQGRGPETADLKAVYQAMEETGVLPPMVAVPEGAVPDFYGIDPAWYEEALFMVSADSLLADEVVLIRARDEAAAGRILPMLQARMEAKAEEAQTYSPQQYAIIKQGQVLSRGRALALMVSPEVARLVRVYQGK